MFFIGSLHFYCLVSLLTITVSHNGTSAANVPTTSQLSSKTSAIILNNTETEADVEVVTTTQAAAAIIKPLDNDKEVSLLRGAWNWFMDYMRSTLNTVEVEAVANETIAELTNDDDEDDVDEVDALKAATRSIRSVAEGRTFGKIRRLQMALIPIVFKFGVISAMVAFLVLLGMKSLFLLKLLVLMNAVAIVGKFLTFKSDIWSNGGHNAHHSAPYGWNPYVQQSWGPTLGVAPQGPPPQSKEIHLHLHGLQAPPYGGNEHSFPYASSNNWNRRSNDPYSAVEYNSYSANLPLEVHTERIVVDELNNADKYNQNYVPQNHRNF